MPKGGTVPNKPAITTRLTPLVGSVRPARGDGKGPMDVMSPLHLLICGIPEPCRGDGTQTCVHRQGDTDLCFSDADVAVYPSRDVAPAAIDRIADLDELAATRAQRDALVSVIQQAIAAAEHGGDPSPILRAALQQPHGAELQLIRGGAG